MNEILFPLMYERRPKEQEVARLAVTSEHTLFWEGLNVTMCICRG